MHEKRLTRWVDCSMPATIADRSRAPARAAIEAPAHFARGQGQSEHTATFSDNILEAERTALQVRPATYHTV